MSHDDLIVFLGLAWALNGEWKQVFKSFLILISVILLFRMSKLRTRIPIESARISTSSSRKLTWRNLRTWRPIIYEKLESTAWSRAANVSDKSRKTRFGQCRRASPRPAEVVLAHCEAISSLSGKTWCLPRLSPKLGWRKASNAEWSKKGSCETTRDCRLGSCSSKSLSHSACGPSYSSDCAGGRCTVWVNCRTVTRAVGRVRLNRVRATDTSQTGPDLPTDCISAYHKLYYFRSQNVTPDSPTDKAQRSHASASKLEKLHKGLGSLYTSQWWASSPSC